MELARLLRRAPDSDAHGSILDGALAAFVDLGIRRTSMGDIARQARTSPATLYRKFPGKSGLVEAVALREIRRVLGQVDARMAEVADEDAETQVLTLMLTVASTMRGHRLLQRLLASEPELILPMLTTGAGPMLALGRDHISGFLHRLQEQGRIGEFDPAPFAESLARLTLSYVLTPETLVPLDDAEALRPYVRAHVLPALGTPSRPGGSS